MDLHVNERQKIDTIALGLLKKEKELEEEEEEEERRRIRRRRRRRKKNAKSRFFTLRGAYVNLRYIAMLYTYLIGNLP